MAIKFPVSGTRVSQGMIFNDLKPPRPEAGADKPAAPAAPALEAARPATHLQEHGWSN
jgi:hypothetical protein